MTQGVKTNFSVHKMLFFLIFIYMAVMWCACECGVLLRVLNGVWDILRCLTRQWVVFSSLITYSAVLRLRDNTCLGDRGVLHTILATILAPLTMMRRNYVLFCIIFNFIRIFQWTLWSHFPFNIPHYMMESNVCNQMTNCWRCALVDGIFPVAHNW